MFGIGKKDDPAKKAKEAAIERGKQTVREFVHKIATASPEAAEKMSQQLRDWCNSDKDLPFEFKRKAMLRAKVLECSINMRACDALLHEAVALATEGMIKEKIAKLGEARKFFGRACKLGAEDDWRRAFKRTEETIQLTGSANRDLPTRAKPEPLPDAPKP
jgi:hypothetical protein